MVAVDLRLGKVISGAGAGFGFGVRWPHLRIGKVYFHAGFGGRQVSDLGILFLLPLLALLLWP